MEKPKIPGCEVRANGDGTFFAYRRVISRGPNGKQVCKRIPLGDPFAAGFEAKLAKVNAELGPKPALPEMKDGAWRIAPRHGSMRWLIIDFKKTLPERKGKKFKGAKLSKTSIDHWNTFLKQIDAEHGDRMAADIEKHHLYAIRDAMRHTPGRANAYMSYLKVLLEHACKRGIIKHNPAAGGFDDKPETREHKPWPPHVIAEVLAECDKSGDYALRLAIVSALCSGQRISDIIRMRPSWIRNGIMIVPESMKTNTAGYIPMHAVWLEEIAKVNAIMQERNLAPMTLVTLKDGRAFKDTTDLQARLREILVSLGHVHRDDKDRPLQRDGSLAIGDDAHKAQTLYKFHGLSKNAICMLIEMGTLSDAEISAIVGKTEAMVRYYGKEARKWMLAKSAAERVTAGRFDLLIAGQESAESYSILKQGDR